MPRVSVRADPSAASILIVHGLAEHKGRYTYVQQKLAEAGYSSDAIDLRGHGEADGFPGKVSGPEEWLDDIGETIAGHEFMIAHSMGTLPALAYLGERGTADLGGVVLSACPIAPGELQLEALANPDGPGVPPQAVSRDPAVVQAYVDDPLVFNDNVPPECTAAVMLAAQRAFAGAPAVRLPVFLVHGGADPIATPEGSQTMHDEIGSVDKTLKIYDGLYHEVFNEPEKDQVIGDVIAWLDAHR